MTERGPGAIVVATSGALLAAAVFVFVLAFSDGTAQTDTFERVAIATAVIPALAVAFAVRPAWLLSIGIALTMFSSHWSDIGIGVAFDRIVLGLGVVSVLVREHRA